MITKCLFVFARKNQSRVTLIAAGSRPDVIEQCCHASSAGNEHDKNQHHPIDDPNIARQPDMYRPGSDSFAYENPWPKLNKGRLDWIFNDGWRRPLAPDQGGNMRRQWLWFQQNPRDEYHDWKQFHQLFFLFMTGTFFLFYFAIMYCRPDWPNAREWALREAHFEIIRREKAGLQHISPDLIERKRVEACLPSEEELRDFEIII